MILAAGLGTRLRPLSALCAKPAMPVRGLPVIAHTLTWLARHDVSEVIVNLHHLPETVRTAIAAHQPEGLVVHYSEERELLGTGGGLRAVAEFLAGSDPSVVVAGDCLVDLDLGAAVARHRARGDRYTLLVLRDDPRAEAFGTLGAAEEDVLRRIGRRFDLGGECARGLFTGIRIVSSDALGGDEPVDWPDGPAFEDLADWLGPQLRAGARDVRLDWISRDEALWEPVGTTDEYLAVNRTPPPLSYLDDIPGQPQAEVMGNEDDVVIVGSGARIDPSAELRRVVVWPGESVPAGVRAHDGVWADGRFVPGEAGG